jgi:hypothetical protein
MIIGSMVAKTWLANRKRGVSIIVPPENPAGSLEATPAYSESLREKLISGIQIVPDRLRTSLAGLTESQMDTLYKNWTIRQIVHHIADSHVHSYIRFKWALTEDNPVIKAYEEAEWVLLDDAKAGAVEPSVALLSGLHAKWVQVLNSMTEKQFERTFVHPQTRETVRLWTALNYYQWHGQHHIAQIQWLREQHGWR